MCEFYVQKIDEKFVFNDCFEGNLTRQKHFLNCKFQFITTKVEYKKVMNLSIDRRRRNSALLNKVFGISFLTLFINFYTNTKQF